jgi:3-(3-hydroxy-phenyl)propionate hydroxylase
MFPQPRVALDGQPVLLDDALGSWFAVLWFGGGPRALDRDALGRWLDLGARVISVRWEGHRSVRPLDDMVVIEDLDGALGRWREVRPDLDVVILRPDRYMAAACSAQRFAEVSSALARAMA